MSWYYAKGWTDQEDGVEQVLIHYVCTPPGQWPDWSRGHESRVLEDRGGFPRTRLRVLRMPRSVWDLQHERDAPEYRFHHYFEVFQHGRRWTTDLVSEDIVYRDLDYVDDGGWATNIFVYWSVGDWAAPVYSPMEDPRFPGDSEFRSTRYCSYRDKDRFHSAKSSMLRAMARPHRWQARVHGPRGADLVQQFHVGRMHPAHEKDEFWLGPDGRSAPGGDSWWVHHL